MYEKTNNTPWSSIIKQGRLTGLGKLLAARKGIVAQQALKETERQTKKLPGYPKTTRIMDKCNKNDLQLLI